MRVLFIGTGEIGVPVLRWLLSSKEHELIGVVTQPDKPVGRSQKIEPPPIKAALTALSVNFLQPDRIKREEAVAQIRAHQPDVIVVMAYGQILPRAVLEIPRIACLNLHASLLPRHRGAAPIQAAIIAGDSETGITVMYMDEGIDTGDILLQSKIPIAADETGGSLHDRLGEIAPAALENALNQLQNGNAPRVPQQNADATYAPKLEREHGRIDLSDPAQASERKIRAFNPWPGAYVVVTDPDGRERKLKILAATIVEGALRLEQVQLEGGKRMSAAELLRGHAWLGARL